MTRVLAAIDLGTNTVRVLVARVDAATGVAPVWAEQTVTRLGEGLAARCTLGPAAAERTLTAVRHYRDRARAVGAAEVILVATAAVRQARDGAAFLDRLRAEPGLRPRVATGEEEAALTLLGASWALGRMAGTFALLDVGGGSTEILVAEHARMLMAVSLALGVVSLAERFFSSDPIEVRALDRCRAYVDARLRAEAWTRIRPFAPTTLVATAGTPTTLAALDLGLRAYDPARVQGYRLTAAAIARLTGRLAALPLAERARIPGLEPGRADVIVPGALVLASVLAGLDISTLVVCDAGLREGILLDAIGWRPRA